MAWAQLAAAQGTAQGVPSTMFPDGNWWKVDISSAPVDPRSDAIIAEIGQWDRRIQYDWGNNYGLPMVTVSGDYPKVWFQGAYYWSNCDNVGYPIPTEALTIPGWTEDLEGTIDNPTLPGDRHLLIYDVDNDLLYEIYQPFHNPNSYPIQIPDQNMVYNITLQPGAYYCSSCCVWDAKTNRVRTEGWTSGDAAGLQIMPGLVKYDEVVAGSPIEHAHRICFQGLSNTAPYYFWPATHYAPGACWWPNGMMLGGRLRLKASVDLSRYDAWPNAKRVMASMQKYGLICADNGGHAMIQGTTDPRWGNYDSSLRYEFFYAFSSTPMTDFEVVQHGWTPNIRHLLFLGDSKTHDELWTTDLLTELRNDYGEPWNSSIFAAGSTTLEWGANNVASIIAAVPAGAAGENVHALVNWGVNEMASMPPKATWIANYQTIIDGIRGKQPTAKVYCVKPWYRGQDANAAIMAGWVDEVVASRPGTTAIGHNEAIWLKGSDNGGTMTYDGVHYSTPAGQAECVNQWIAILPQYAPDTIGMGQFVPPEFDVAADGWTAVGGTGSLVSAVDETSPGSDSDYIISPAAPSNATAVLKLRTVNPPKTGGTCKLLLRVKKV